MLQFVAIDLSSVGDVAPSIANEVNSTQEN
ncbi:hypothetical protein Q644_02015 [Brucella intermedia 229E]|uniref:Uncharacterized protein n=1 Tax=Brucella intermedia 229E TaxID=1337887 RepID=U4VI72_9HYPH|nr:hypothetical protein Q644_02015 [Brucella intermedia 229E]